MQLAIAANCHFVSVVYYSGDGLWRSAGPSSASHKPSSWEQIGFPQLRRNRDFGFYNSQAKPVVAVA